jgi:hypothetical protein
MSFTYILVSGFNLHLSVMIPEPTSVHTTPHHFTLLHSYIAYYTPTRKHGAWQSLSRSGQRLMQLQSNLTMFEALPDGIL